MAEGQAVLGQQRLGLGAAQAGLEGRGHRDGVDVDQALHPAQVEADQAGVAVAARGQAAGDRRTAAERHDREVVLDREREHGRDVVGTAGTDHGVGCVGQVAGPGAEQVGGRLAAGAQPAGVVVGEHVLGAEEVAQALQQRRLDRRDRQRGFGHGGPLDQAEGHLDQAAGGLGQGGGGGGVTPALGVHLDGGLLGGHVLQCDT